MAFLGSRGFGLVTLVSVLALHAAASPVLLSALKVRQDDPDSEFPSPEECIDKSFTNPGWLIYGPVLRVINGSTGGSQGDLRFQAVNKATGTTAMCDIRNIELDPVGAAATDVWYDCQDVPDLQFQFKLEELDMRLRGSWACKNNPKLVFSSNGTWEYPVIQACLDYPATARGDEVMCIMGNSQVSGSLSKPVKIAPQLPLYPYTPWELSERCVDRSKDPEWHINDFKYTHHGQETTSGTQAYYDLALNVTNISNNERVLCSVKVDEPAPKGVNPWMKCVSAAETPGSLVASTDVMFDHENAILGLRQKWYCTDGILGVDPTEFTATGYLSATLDCDTNDIHCGLAVPAEGGPNKFTGYWPSPPTMPHTPYTKSCTIGSFVNTTSLSLQEYNIESGADGKLWGTFTLANPGPMDSYRLNKIPVVDDGNWHDCVAGEAEALPWQLVGCRYSLDRAGHHLGFQLQWYCDDRDPSHAILFDVTATAELPAEKCAKLTSSDKKESCSLANNAQQVNLPVSSLSYKSAGIMDRGPILPWI